MPAGDNITAPIPSGSTESLAFDEFADGSKAGVCRLDIGSGSTEGRVTAANPLPVGTQPANTATANVAGSKTSVTTGTAVEVLAAFATRRRGMLIPTDGDVYMSLTGTADANSGIVPAGTPINIDGFSGAVSMLGKDGTVVVSRWEY